jgi:hypothetical protein
LKSFLHEVLCNNMLNRGVLDAWRLELFGRGKFSKNLAFFEKSTLLPVLRRFCMRALWRGFEWKIPIFCTRSLWPAPHTPQQFSQKAQGTDHFLCAYWTAGFTARPPDIRGFRKLLFFDMGCVYTDMCSTILLCELNRYSFKKLPVGSTIFCCIFQFFEVTKSSILQANFKIVWIQLA